MSLEFLTEKFLIENNYFDGPVIVTGAEEGPYEAPR